jgi:hypothetical protein
MTVGDLVRLKGQEPLWASNNEVGMIVEIHHVKVAYPDYRTPTTMLVFFPLEIRGWSEKWFHKCELEVINESR